MQTGKGVGEGALTWEDICVWAAKIELLIALRVKKARKTLTLFWLFMMKITVVKSFQIYQKGIWCIFASSTFEEVPSLISRVERTFLLFISGLAKAALNRPFVLKKAFVDSTAFSIFGLWRLNVIKWPEDPLKEGYFLQKNNTILKADRTFFYIVIWS